MKKTLSLLTVSGMMLLLVACGSTKEQTNSSTKQSENSSLRSENSSLRQKINKQSESKATQPQQDQISDAEYAMMGFLKLQSEDSSPAELVQNLRDDHSNMSWRTNGNKFFINFGAHTTTMTVNSDSVEVTYDDIEGDHMGNQNGHRLYSKAVLKNEFGSYQNTIRQIING